MRLPNRPRTGAGTSVSGAGFLGMDDGRTDSEQSTNLADAPTTRGPMSPIYVSCVS